MKCKACNGTGYITACVYESDEIGFVDKNYECAVCHGTGQIEQTNEEWLRGATFEELAGAIYEWYSLGYTRGKNGKKLNSITEVVEWLKQQHTNE